MKRKILSEKIYTAKNEIKRIWCELKKSKNKSLFKRGVLYSYIIDTEKKTVKIVPYNEEYTTKGTVSHKKNGEIEIIDICNKKIQDLFKDYKQYKITVFEDEIFIEGYVQGEINSDEKLDENQSSVVSFANVLKFKSKESRKRTIMRFPINYYEMLMKASGLEGQISFFDSITTDYEYTVDESSNISTSSVLNSNTVKRDKPIVKNAIKLLSLFSGIGAFEEALKNIKQPFVLTNYCEFQPFISKSYSLIHDVPESKNLGDVTKVDETKLEDFDVMTFGFPCQDLSSLGDQKGFFNENGEKTRSGLFFDAIRIMKHKLPKVAIIENVRALVSKPMKENFEKMKELISEMGYNFYHTIMNTKDYGIPQSRNRFFGVCIRKDVDTETFEFPEKQPLTTVASDYYDDVNTISDDYYLEEKHHKYFNEMRLKKKYSSLNSDVLVCMTTKQGQKSNPQNFVQDEKGYRILTEAEMFAFQGFKKEDAKKLMNNGITTSQVGYMCGNTISVCTVEHIFKKLIEALPNVFCRDNVVPFSAI